LQKDFLVYVPNFINSEIVLQLVGLFTYSCFILMKMNYLTIAYMWGVFCLIPFLLDLAMIIFSLIKNIKYEYVDA